MSNTKLINTLLCEGLMSYLAKAAVKNMADATLGGSMGNIYTNWTEDELMNKISMLTAKIRNMYKTPETFDYEDIKLAEAELKKLKTELKHKQIRNVITGAVLNTIINRLAGPDIANVIRTGELSAVLPYAYSKFRDKEGDIPDILPLISGLAGTAVAGVINSKIK